jgi:hypothetical protein
MTRRIASVAIAPPTSIYSLISDYRDVHADVKDGRRAFPVPPRAARADSDVIEAKIAV